MNHIELFAGCGGLSLGLETAGFELVMANELSPMASETFAYNILNAELYFKIIIFVLPTCPHWLEFCLGNSWILLIRKS